MKWQFWIDVGGTFTDCVANAPDGRLHTAKVLSSGVVKGRITNWIDGLTFRDAARAEEPGDFWVGYRIHLLDGQGRRARTAGIAAFDGVTGTITVDAWAPADPQVDDLHAADACLAYEIESDEGAPVLAMRQVLRARLSDPLPRCDVRLGTTRGTNALLERKGARVAFVTTRGFADILHIANQDRPRLFELTIRKPAPLFETVVEVEERIAADGRVLHAIDEPALRRELQRVREAGVRSLAVCLVHAWNNPRHEQRVAEIAREMGFDQVCLSHETAPRIKIVPRAETTVLDAYLTPLLRDYVRDLKDRLGEQSSLRLMTSSGGLVASEQFRGTDSILSGPAGGVVGFSRVAERAGFPRAIGFDMGGTSTDVARYDGQFEYEFEGSKAGVRFATPMLAIETVAAGGGSVCGFDGVQLFVGPESAGADPGPACYGRGGPLTVTDVNLALGRLVPGEFPFPLDLAAVERRLADLCDEIARSPLGRMYSPVELAEGFIHIANANMVRALRKISVARGYDPAEYVLVTFGGAGGQHACALAEALGMRAVLAHPFAGVLSAYGIGCADVRRQAERPVLQPCSGETFAAIEPVRRSLELTLIQEIENEGIARERIATSWSLDLRYSGVEAVLNIPRPPDDDFITAYESRHEQVYGYRHSGRTVEIAALRVEAVGHTADPPSSETPESPRRPEPARVQGLWLDARRHEAGVYHRRDLHSGDILEGPAIVCEPTSTLVIPPGWTGCVTGRGEIVLNASAGRCTAPRAAAKGGEEDAAPDPVTLEVFNHHFASIAEQMGLTLQRTAISTNVKERLDFSCAVFDRQGALVVNAPHIPVHLGAMGETVRAVLADHADWSPGDVVVTNDPYRGGSHLPDVTVVTPVFDPRSQELLYITASRAHHAEIGGVTPGSMPPFSRNLAEEGVLIRGLRLVDRGRSREEELRQLLLSAEYPSRRVEDNLADVAAQAAANQLGARLLLELTAAHGFSVVDACMQGIREAAALKMRRALARHGEGVYAYVDHLDDGSSIAATITIRGEHATIDFTGTGPVLPTNLNANRAIVMAAVMYSFRCLIAEDLPLNSGMLEPLSVVLPECLLNPPAAADPRDCPAIVGGNVETSQRVVDVLLGALGLAAASQGTMNNLTFGNDRFGYYETICGGSGATPEGDGADAVHTHMTNTRLTDVEVLEHRYPVRVDEFRIRRGSGGEGLHRGGDGVVRRLEFLAPLHVSMVSQRRGAYLPFGLSGGSPGRAGRNSIIRAASGEATDLGGAFQTIAAPGDILQIETPGGGGWGTAEAAK